MAGLQQLIKKSGNSAFYNWVLNRVLSKAIPFNAPHRFRIAHIQEGKTTILLPYIRSNKNHVKGIHACALAALCEYTIGITLVSCLPDDKFRLILKNLSLEYHYQAKMDVSATFVLSSEMMTAKITHPLESADSVFCELEIDVYDVSKNHICTGRANWQIKKWEKVRSK